MTPKTRFAVVVALATFVGGCTGNDPVADVPKPTTATVLSAPPSTGASVSIAMEQAEVLYEQDWVGEPDLDEISSALDTAGIAALVRVSGFSEADETRVEILRSPSTGSVTTRVFSTAEFPNAILTVSSSAENGQQPCKRRSDSEWKPLPVRETRGCFRRAGGDRSMWWLEDGLHLTATTTQSKNAMDLALSDWQVLPYACRNPLASGDVDGDGLPDDIERLNGSQDNALVCTSDGEVHLVPEVPPNISVFDVVDVDGDGLLEVRTGGTTAYAAFISFSRFESGYLRPFGEYVVGTHWRVRCVDLDGDGLLEIIQGELDTDNQTWHVTTYQVADDRYEIVDDRSGALRAAPNSEEPLLPSEAQSAELRREMGSEPGSDMRSDACPSA